MEKRVAGLTHAHKPITFSEKQLFELQDAFLLPGFHAHEVATVSEGRALLRALIPLFHATSQIGFLSLSKSRFSFPVVSLYHEFKELGLFSKDKSAWEEYFFTSFYFDFLVIEGTSELCAFSWFECFKELVQGSAFLSSLLLVYDQA
jgi:hypothetical protein